MKVSMLKSGFLIAVMSVLLAACSSTSTDEEAGGVATVPEDDVATGTVTDTGVSGRGMDMDTSLDTVFYFDFDKAILRPEARTALRQHAERLANSPRNIRLEGHADERGSREYNMALGERRANSVKEFLMLQGVDGSYIEVISYGEERPASMGSDEQSWAMNRRVELN